MRKNLLVFSKMVVVAVAVALTGCATSGDLAKVQAQEKLIDAKADQAIKEAQIAKAAADAATVKADAAAARADEAAKKAEERELLAQERERIANEKAARAEAAFQKSMMK